MDRDDRDVLLENDQVAEAFGFEDSAALRIAYLEAAYDEERS